MQFQCPHCQSIVSIPDTECGQPVGCGNCGGVSIVPGSRFSPSVVIDDFVIKEIIGKGGMGMVYLAHQLSLDRPVALKVLMQEFSQDRDFVVDFVKEARAAARLNHLNIVQSYAVGEEDGIYFFAMEYVEGSTLKKIMKAEGTVGIANAIQIMRQIAEALDFAWKNQSLVHRDIKPDNIMITNKGVAKLADLGLARKAAELADVDEEDEVMGTPQYISPEQLLGRPMDVRGDIYSLGATFFHAVTGRFPFEGNSAGEIARMHLEAQLESAHDVNESVPPQVTEVIDRMMAKRPEDRYNDAAELVAALDELLSKVGDQEEEEEEEAPVSKKSAKLKKKRRPRKKAAPMVEVESVDEDELATEEPIAGEEAAAPAVPTKVIPKKTGGPKKKTTIRKRQPKASVEQDADVPGAAKEKSRTPKKSVIPAVLIGVAALVAIAAIVGALFATVLADKPPTDEASLLRQLEIARPSEMAAFRELQPLIGVKPANLKEARDMHAQFMQFKANPNHRDSIFVLPHGQASYHRSLGLEDKHELTLRKLAKGIGGVVTRDLEMIEEYEVRFLREDWKDKERAGLKLRRFTSALASVHEEQAMLLIDKIGQVNQSVQDVFDEVERGVDSLEKIFERERRSVIGAVVPHCAEGDFTEGLDLLRDLQTDEGKQGYPARASRQISRAEGVVRASRNLKDNAERSFQRKLKSLMVKFEVPEAWDASDANRAFNDAIGEAVEGGAFDDLKQSLRGLEEREQDFYALRNEWFDSLGECLGWGQQYYLLVATTGAKLNGHKVRFKEVVIDGLGRQRILSIGRTHMIVDKEQHSPQLGNYRSIGTFKKEIKEIPWPMFQELAITSYGSEDLDLQRNLGAFALVTGRFKDARINLMAAGAEFMLGIFDDIYFAYGLHAATREDADTDKICRLLQAKCESAEDCGTWKKLINKLCQ